MLSRSTFNQRLQHQTQHHRNMQSIFKKSGRRSFPASSTGTNQPIREYHFSYSSYFRLTRRSASSSYSPQSCLIGADRRAGRHCDERDRDISRCSEGGKCSGWQDSLHRPRRGPPPPSAHYARCKCPATLTMIAYLTSALTGGETEQRGMGCCHGQA